VPAGASSPIPLAFDQLREHPGAVPGEIPGLLERLAEVPGPRGPRGVRPDPLFPKRCLPAEATVRRLPGRIDGDASDRAAGRWLAGITKRTSRDYAEALADRMVAPAMTGTALRGPSRRGGRGGRGC
jgi:hypothetical protein